MPYLFLSCFTNLTPATIAALEDGQDFQDEDEQIQDGDKDRDGQSNGIGQAVGHVFGALHIEQEVGREKAYTGYTN